MEMYIHVENLTCPSMITAEDDLLGKGESHAQHIFIRRNVTHKMNRTLALQWESKTVRCSLHHIRLRVFVLGEAVAVHCGEGPITGRLMVQKAPKGIQELESQSRQVHHNMNPHLSFQQCRQLLLQRSLDEGSAIQVEGSDFVLHLVEFAVVLQPLVGVGVEIIGYNICTQAGSGDSERSNASKDIKDCVTMFDKVYYTLVFCAEPRIPVNTREVKLVSDTIFFHLWCKRVTLTTNQ